MARKIGGERRGAYTGGTAGGRTDVIHEVIAAECKLLSQPKFRDMKLACDQALENAEPGQVPIAFVRRKGDNWGDGLVIMKMDQFSNLTQRLIDALPGDDDGESDSGC